MLVKRGLLCDDKEVSLGVGRQWTFSTCDWKDLGSLGIGCSIISLGCFAVCVCTAFSGLRHVGPWFPNQGLKLHPLPWRQILNYCPDGRFLTTALPGKSLEASFLLHLTEWTTVLWIQYANTWSPFPYGHTHSSVLTFIYLKLRV